MTEFRIVSNPKKDSNGCLGFTVPFEDSKELDVSQKYEITIKGPIRDVRTVRGKIIVKFR